MAQSVLFVTDSDSNVKFATSFGQHLRGAGLDPKVVYVGQELASLTQAANAVQDGFKVDVAPSFDSLFASRDLLRYDVIFVLVTGRQIKEFCNNLNALALTYGVAKPVTMGGFIGEWISANAQVEERGALDVFLVNRADELEKFREICARAAHGKTLKALPYCFLVRHPFAKPLAPTFDYDLSKTIVFADQVQVPRTSGERRFLYENLELLAKKAPNLKLYFCTREILGGATNHRSLGGISDFLGAQRLAALPNVFVEQGTFQKRLAEADLVLSVSSTAGVEALINGVPALFLRGFTSSGAEKFAHTGLLVDLYELKSPKKFTIDPAFHADVSRTDVWDELAAFVRQQPERNVEGRPSRRAVRTSLLATSTPSGMYEELVYDVLGFNEVEELGATINVVPADLKTASEAARAAAARYSSTFVVTDAPSIAAGGPGPIFVATAVKDAVATAEIAISGAEGTLHLPFAVDSQDVIEISGSVHGEPLKLTCRKAGVDVSFSEPSAIQAIRGAYKVGAEVFSVYRIRSFVPFDLTSVKVVRGVGGVPPVGVGYENSYVFTKLGRIAPSLEPRAGTIPSHDQDGQVTVFRFDRDVAGHTGPLFTLAGADGSSLEVAALNGARIGLTMTVGNQVIVKQAPLGVLNVRMVVVSTGTMTIVMTNENLAAFEAPFVPQALEVNPDIRGGFTVNLLAAFAAHISLSSANTLIEQILLRFFSSSAYAKKHREIPDFRTGLEARLGKPPAPEAQPQAKEKAPKEEKAAAKAAVKPVEPKPAKPALAVVAKAPKVAKLEPVLAKAAKPVATSQAVNSTHEMSRVVGDYLDLLSAEDLSAAFDVAKGHNSLIAFSERFLYEKNYGKALAVSLIASERTPTSKAHLMICAKSLAELGAPERAEIFLDRVQRLAPDDASLRLKANAIRGNVANDRGGGVAGLFKRAFGR